MPETGRVAPGAAPCGRASFSPESRPQLFRIARLGRRGPSPATSGGSSCKLLARQHQELDTLVGNSAIGLLLTGHCRPPLLLDVVTPLPGIGLLHLFELLDLPRI